MGRRKRAVNLTDKYFEAFPHFNFRYDSTIIPFLNVYQQAGENEKLKHHLRILATETADYLEFYYSLDKEDLESSFRTDYLYSTRALNDVLRISSQMNDPEFEQEMKDLLSMYQTENLLG